MRSLVFVTVAVLLLSAAMGISVFQHGMEAGRQIASFQSTGANMQDWLCANKADKNCAEKLPLPEMRSEFLLRTIQTLHDAFNNRENFPVLPSPLSLLQKGKRPETIKEGRELLEPIHEIHAGNTTYPYFGFLPLVDATVQVGGPDMTYHTPCFSKVIANAVMINSSMVRVQVTTSGHTGFFCVDSVILMGGTEAIGEVGGNGVTNFHLDISAFKDDVARVWLLNNRGILMGRVQDGWLQAALDLVSTVTMLIGFAEPNVAGATFKANTEFVQTYVEFNQSRMGATMRLREQDMTGHFVAKDIDPSEINSGDIFMIIRPDGLDPMIAWAEGGSVGHTTIAMRSPTNNSLYVCESTTKDPYWPTNGIQCHSWAEWWPLAHKAQYNVVMLPMKPSVRAGFDVTKAWDFFYEHEGLNYGYLVLLAGWLDMKHGDQNSPCVPPDFKKCLNRPLMERVLVLIDDLSGNNADNVVRQNFAHRVGLWPQQVSAAESIMHGQKHLGMNTISDLYSVVEQDSWLYNTTRYNKSVTGSSMVCNVFVCNMLKHGGVFSSINSEIQCGESNLWTLYSSTLWDSAKMGEGRPKVCRDADPTNPLCQMMGNWTLHLHPDLNSRPIYANMSNHCPSIGPNYYYPNNC